MYGKPVMTCLKCQVYLYCVEADHIFECYTLNDNRARTMTHSTALIKKKTKFSSYIRKFRMENSHLIFAHFLIYYGALPHIWLSNCSTLNFLIYEENLIYFFIRVPSPPPPPTGSPSLGLHGSITLTNLKENSSMAKLPIYFKKQRGHPHGWGTITCKTIYLNHVCHPTSPPPPPEQLLT